MKTRADIIARVVGEVRLSKKSIEVPETATQRFTSLMQRLARM